MIPLPLKDQAMFKRFTAFLQQQKVRKGNLLLIHDVDGDGLSSGKILKAGLEMLGIKVKLRFAAHDRTNLFGDFLLEFIKKRQVQAILTTDFNLYATNYPAQKEALKNLPLIVFDHHETPKEIDSNIIYFHPALTYGFAEPSQYCTTKLVYDLLQEFADLSELDWVCAIGIVSDSTYKTWKEFVDATLKKLNLPVPKSPFDSELQKVGTLLYYGLAMGKETAEKAIKTYFTASSYPEALQGLQEYEIVGKEIDYFMEHWKEFAEEHKDLIFIKIQPKYKINSLLSSQISYKYPKKTIVIGSPSKAEEGKEPEQFSFSLRRQDGTVNLPALLKEIARQLPGAVGGGHIPASGAKCKIDDYEKFKQLFLKLQEKYKINKYKMIK